mmetsp:Transcript_6962/g.42612  ORF Transcript_6962/g.42612 Transcript_6962/m.42612 type:complete len:243 (+) Transcript_6962:176-904(+)
MPHETAAGRTQLLPQAKNTAPRHQRIQPTHQQRRRAEIGGFRVGKTFPPRNHRQQVDQPCDHPVVSSARAPPGIGKVQLRSGHVVGRMHHGRTDAGKTTAARKDGDRPAGTDLSTLRDAHGRKLAGRVQAAVCALHQEGPTVQAQAQGNDEAPARRILHQAVGKLAVLKPQEEDQRRRGAPFRLVPNDTSALPTLRLAETQRFARVHHEETQGRRKKRSVEGSSNRSNEEVSTGRSRRATTT